MKVLGGVLLKTSRSVDRVRAVPLVLVCASLAASCISSPATNSVVDSVRQSVDFEGLLPAAFGNSVTVQYFTQNFTWSNLGTTPATRSGTWQLSAPIPANGWFPPCGTAVVRAISNQNQQLRVTDSACLTALPADATQAEKDACTKTTLVLHQAHIHDGDLSIVGADQAEPHQCTTKVVGNLTVDNGTSPTIELPYLHDVTGNVDVTLNRYIHFDPPPPDPPITVDFVTGRFEAPILASVGGNVALHTIKDPQIGGLGQATFDFGMDALTSVGGDIWVDNTAFPGNSKGLNALTSLGGNVTLDWAPNDVNSSVLLSSLTQVEGSVSISVNPNANRMLGALERVGQDLTITTPTSTWHATPLFLGSLERVEGDLTLQRASVGTQCSTLGTLAYVGGVLTLENSGTSSGYLGVNAATPLSVGAFALVDGNAAAIPAGPDFEVRDDGDVTVSNNPNLCDCSLNAFITQLEGNGWAGSAVTSGNGGQASCMPCPAAATCQ
jgi:hypothetical protein